jgi:Xaa-Pro dipeptidase
MRFLPTNIEATTTRGRTVTLRFSAEEHAARLAATRGELQRRNLAALLVFAQESHYYLTGYDTAGYVFFQVGIIMANGTLNVLLTRRPDLQQATVASLYDDIRLWLNAEDANPAQDLCDILIELGLSGNKIGVEYATYGLTAANGRAVDAALDGKFMTVDASDLVRRQRLVKSSAELTYVRKAGKLADLTIHAMLAASRPGILDSAVTAAGMREMLECGGDIPSGGPLVNSGPRALFGRGVGGPRMIEARDQLLLELATSVCRYHVCIEHTVAVGSPDPRQVDMIKIAADALHEVTAAARPGRELGTLDDIHRRVLDAAGFANERFAACGYALGCTFRPTWMDVPPMIYSGNPLVLEPGMVFFVHIMIPDRNTGLTAGVGWTFAITDGAAEIFSDIPLKLHVGATS